MEQNSRLNINIEYHIADPYLDTLKRSGLFY